LRRAGRQRNTQQRAQEIQAALRTDYLQAPGAVARAYGAAARSAIRLISAHTTEIAGPEAALAEHFEQHPDAKIVRSLPGLGTVPGARVPGESGDDRTRFASPQSRQNYAGTSPITKATGRSRIVLARHARNRRLADALDRWAFCSLIHSPGARAHYDQLRRRPQTHRPSHPPGSPARHIPTGAAPRRPANLLTSAMSARWRQLRPPRWCTDRPVDGRGAGA
jgi:transposase